LTSTDNGVRLDQIAGLVEVFLALLQASFPRNVPDDFDRVAQRRQERAGEPRRKFFLPQSLDNSQNAERISICGSRPRKQPESARAG
jgi:hypothetical protein